MLLSILTYIMDALFCQGTLRFEKQVHWRWHARFSYRQHFRGLRGKGFPTNSRHSNGHKLCPSTSWHISVLIRSGIHTVFALHRREKKYQFNFTYRYIDDVLSINNPDFENYLGRIPLSLRSKTRRSATSLLPNFDLLLSIESDGQLRNSLYDKRDDFNFCITNFSFLSSNIPSLPAYGVLSHISYGMPGLAPLLNVLF